LRLWATLAAFLGSFSATLHPDLLFAKWRYSFDLGSSRLRWLLQGDCRPLPWCLAHSDCVHPRPRLYAPSTQIVYVSINLHADADWVHPRPRLCAPSTQIVYTLDPDSRHSTAKTAHWLVSNVKSLPQQLNFSPVYSLVKLFHRTLQSSDWQSRSPRSSLVI